MHSANAASAVSPRKPSSLRQRVLSAAVLIPLVIALVWWSVWSVVALLAAVAVLATLELYAAFAHGGHRPQVRVGVVLALAPLAAAALQRYTSFPLGPPAIVLVIVASLVAMLPRHDQERALADWALTAAGALYTGVLLSQIVLLRDLATPLCSGLFADLGLAPGAGWIFLVLLITWGQDVLAYFVGKYLGRRRMAPRLSPKKTWEGAAGGMLGALLGAWLGVALFGLPVSLAQGALLGLVGGIIGPLGDLSESFIKRQVGLKDAGHLIPGHGGVLDRIDSLLFTAPILYYLIVLLTGGAGAP